MRALLDELKEDFLEDLSQSLENFRDYWAAGRIDSGLAARQWQHRRRARGDLSPAVKTLKKWADAYIDATDPELSKQIKSDAKFT